MHVGMGDAPARGRGASPDGRGKLVRPKSISAGRIKTGLASWSAEELARLVERLGTDAQYQRIAKKLRSCGLGGQVFSDDDGATECVRLIEGETRERLSGLKRKNLVNTFRELRMDLDKEAAHRGLVSDDVPPAMPSTTPSPSPGMPTPTSTPLPPPVADAEVGTAKTHACWHVLPFVMLMTAVVCAWSSIVNRSLGRYDESYDAVDGPLKLRPTRVGEENQKVEVVDAPLKLRPTRVGEENQKVEVVLGDAGAMDIGAHRRRLDTADYTESITALKTFLMDGYAPATPPANAQLQVEFSLQKLLDVDTDLQVIHIIGWWRHYWVDSRCVIPLVMPRMTTI